MQESTEPKGKGRRTPAEEALDQHFGRRLRELRVSRGLTQQQVADVLGTCFQQVQKYETGRDRISASRLCTIAWALDVGPEYFYQTFEPGTPVDTATPLEARMIDEVRRRETLELARLYSSFEAPLRGAFMALLRRAAELLPPVDEERAA